MPSYHCRAAGDGKVKDQDGNVWHGELNSHGGAALQLEVLPM